MKLLIILLAIWLGIASAAEPQRNLEITPASGEKRVALVIGNSAYKDAPLKNPVNDAKDMAAMLRSLGFEVIEKTDTSQKEMNLAIAQFGERLRGDTVALFFYAGHGMQVKGKNYLIPTDAQITTEATVRAMAVDVDTVMDQLAVSPMNIVILDACRNNPFERKFRSSSGGLSQMDAPKGSLIAYATAPGKTAADGDSRNGLYTQELLKHIQTPGLALEAVFKRVRNGVMVASGEAQTPWESSSLTGDFYFLTGTQTQIAPALLPMPGGRSPEQIEDELWDSIKNETKTHVFEEYIKHYPNGRYLAQARIKLSSIKVESEKDEIGEIFAQYAKKQDNRTVVVLFRAKDNVSTAQANIARLMRTIDSGAIFNPYWIINLPRKTINPRTGCGIVVGTWYQAGFPVKGKWERIMEEAGSFTESYSIGYAVPGTNGYEFDDTETMKSLVKHCTGHSL